MVMRGGFWANEIGALTLGHSFFTCPPLTSLYMDVKQKILLLACDLFIKGVRRGSGEREEEEEEEWGGDHVVVVTHTKDSP